DAARAVREAGGRVVRADDQAGADEDGSVAEGRLRLLLARRLERAVVRVVLEHPVGRLVAELLGRIALDPRVAIVGVVRNRGDEDVAAGGTGEEARRVAHVPRDVARCVEDRVPGPALE